LASSANMLAFIGNLQCLSILLIATRNRETDDADPCGTLFSCIQLSDSWFEVLIWNDLFFRKFVIKFSILPGHIILINFVII
jgi:hypothetical protein